MALHDFAPSDIQTTEEYMDDLTIRDYFAGLALSNLCSHSIPKGQVEMMAAFAYDLAEAMMNERKRRNSG